MRRFVLIVGCLMLFVSSGIEIVYATPSITSTIMVKMVKGLTAAEQAAIIARNGGVEISSVPVLRLHVISVPAENLFFCRLFERVIVFVCEVVSYLIF